MSQPGPPDIEDQGAVFISNWGGTAVSRPQYGGVFLFAMRGLGKEARACGGL